MFCEENLGKINKCELFRNGSVHEFYRLKELITLEQVNTSVVGKKRILISKRLETIIPIVLRSVIYLSVLKHPFSSPSVADRIFAFLQANYLLIMRHSCENLFPRSSRQVTTYQKKDVLRTYAANMSVIDVSR